MEWILDKHFHVRDHSCIPSETVITVLTLPDYTARIGQTDAVSLLRRVKCPEWLQLVECPDISLRGIIPGVCRCPS